MRGLQGSQPLWRIEPNGTQSERVLLIHLDLPFRAKILLKMGNSNAHFT